MKLKPLPAFFFLLWLTILLLIYFIVQKPAFVGVGGGLINFAGSLLFDALFVFTCLVLGYWFVPIDSSPAQRFIFSLGIGMGVLGLAGFLLAVSRLANAYSMPLILLAILFLSRKNIPNALSDSKDILFALVETSQAVPWWMPVFGSAFLVLAVIYSFAPPVEGFDGLFYHLTVPSLWLRDGGLRLMNMPHYWFPSLMEGMFVWPLSLGFESSTQFIHLIFGLLSCLLVWDLTSRLFGIRAAWWSLAIFMSMPSLPWLSAWAYTDMGLVFFSLAALSALIFWRETNSVGWLLVCGAMSGFALGIKYTSFLLPVIILVFLVVWRRSGGYSFLKTVSVFAGMTILTGGVWYLRNWIWMGNPVYPFAFGGLFWDGFRANWYSGTGTGIGWNFLDILSLPVVAMLGYKDQNFFDGRYGPLFLVLFPSGVAVMWNAWRTKHKNFDALSLLAVFGTIFILVWTFGVIDTIHLFQTRLSWPGLIALIPILAAGAGELQKLDIPRLRISFIFSTIVGMMIFVFLLDFGLLILDRKPWSVALGLETRASYVAQMQPEYAQALALVEETPPSAYIYLINESRSYWMERQVQPDPIHDNLAHDLYLYPTNEAMLDVWREVGYTHVLIRNVSFYMESKDENIDTERFSSFVAGLIKLEETSDFILFEIP